jgi:PIN domain nuclease of toxin-antitoxin system
MMLLDTCGLLWYTEDQDKLSATAKKHCEQIYHNGAFISSISIWEIGLKIKNGKLDIGTTIDDYLSRLKSLNTIEIIPVDEKIWLESLRLDWEHRDPADRAIVATANLKQLPILTSDTIIRAFYKKIIW